MFDNFKVYNYSKSLVSPEGYGRHEANFLSGDIINGFETVIGTGLQITAKPGNAVLRSGSGGTASAHLVSLTADFTLTLATADTSNPRIDAIVLYVDTSVTLPSGTPTAANLDGLGVAKIIKVNGTPNSNPSAPNTAAIQSAIGSTSYPYTVLATWRVNASVSALSQTNCTDTRVFAAPTNPRALGQSSFIESGGAPSFTASTLNGSIAAGVAWISVGGVLVPQSFNTLNYTMAASKDRYFYVTLGNATVQAAADTTNGGVAPTLPANSVWLTKVVSGASITSVRRLTRNSTPNIIVQKSGGIMTITGWTFIQGNGTSTGPDKVVSFPESFSGTPIIVTSNSGVRVVSDPVHYEDLDATFSVNRVDWRIKTKASNAFVINYLSDAAISNAVRVGVAWQATGPVA